MTTDIYYAEHFRNGIFTGKEVKVKDNGFETWLTCPDCGECVWEVNDPVYSNGDMVCDCGARFSNFRDE